MGHCASNLSESEKQTCKKSKIIDSEMLLEQQNKQNQIKILLLGAGESGKSTVFKQMKILYGEGFSQFDCLEYKKFVYLNVVESMKALCVACRAMNFMDKVETKHEYDLVMAELQSPQHFFGINLTIELSTAIKTLWTDPGIQMAWAQRYSIQIPDCAYFYFTNIDRISALNYVPTVEDVLYTRVRTCGIIEERYIVDTATFLMIDVGGQRNERKKWIHCFEGVNAIIFVIALNEFNQTLFEDEAVNRMVESINLFNEVCNNTYFLTTSVMLFMNKRDLFEEKITTTNIASVPEFSDYSGPPFDYVEGVKYFVEKFSNANKEKSRDLYFHVTCATDTNNIEFVFNTCKDIILRESLAENGFKY